MQKMQKIDFFHAKNFYKWPFLVKIDPWSSSITQV